MKKKIIAIVGPTASGKSAAAIEVAKKFDGEILCVDSRTVYRGMDVGTAKPPPSPLLKKEGENSVRHYGLDLVNPDEEMNGALFKEYADKVITDIISRGKLPILCGGTGLWFDMILSDFQPPPGPDKTLRTELEKKTTEELFKKYKELDPIGAEKIDQNNPRRLIRAIEVCQLTSRPFSEQMKRNESPYNVLWLGIDQPRDELNKRIDQRVEEMLKNGLLEEVKNLLDKYGENVYAMSGIGYRQIIDYLLGRITFFAAVEKIKSDTKAYAKRQRTWFKRNKNIHWIKNVSEAFDLMRDWQTL